jgi:hypothetical protein
MHHVILVEYDESALHGSCCVALSRLDVFPEDTPSVLDGAQKRILVGIIHDDAIPQAGIQVDTGRFVPIWP